MSFGIHPYQLYTLHSIVLWKEKIERYNLKSLEMRELNRTMRQGSRLIGRNRVERYLTEKSFNSYFCGTIECSKEFRETLDKVLELERKIQKEVCKMKPNAYVMEIYLLKNNRKFSEMDVDLRRNIKEMLFYMKIRDYEFEPCCPQGLTEIELSERFVNIINEFIGDKDISERYTAFKEEYILNKVKYCYLCKCKYDINTKHKCNKI